MRNYDYNSDEVDEIFDKIYAAFDRYPGDPIARLNLIRDVLPKPSKIGEPGDVLNATVTSDDNCITTDDCVWVEVNINGWTEIIEVPADEVREAL